jgi:hypothetical protein
MMVLNRSNLREIILALAFFFNPLGYNEVFALIMSFTGSYWSAAFVMYLFAGTLFTTYFAIRFWDKKKNNRVCT